jgi:beta-glucosidase
VAYVRGVQSAGVGTSVKHFACNNQEFERFRSDSVVDERTLREIYLPAFEAVIKEARPWTVMSAYNRLNGQYASRHDWLLRKALKQEWGFDGFVISDWGAVHHVEESVRGGLDVEMPGPAKYLGPLLTAAVRHWQIEESEIDDAVRRVLGVVARSGKLSARRRSAGKVNTPAHQRLARQLACESQVLLKNEAGTLPLIRKSLRSLAVIGPNAAAFQVGGGGSSAAVPPYTSQPLEALQRALGNRVRIEHAEGCDNREQLLPMEPPKKFRVEFFPGDGVFRFLTSVVGESSLYLDDERILANSFERAPSSGPDFAPHGAPHARFVDVELKMGREYRLRLEYFKPALADFTLMKLRFGRPPGWGAAEQIAKAAEMAARCDAAVVFVGMPSKYEHEGDDRPHMNLPGQQDELVRAVARANPRTAVVLNVGSPVTLPWSNEVPAVLLSWYAGQEAGNAIARVRLGQADPGGRLPVTFPVRYEDNPTFGNYPGDRQARYEEGLFVGYRHYDKRAVAPLFAFGHGLSYTNFEYRNLRVPRRISPGRSVRVSIEVRNTGARAGSEVVQVYVGDRECSVPRPVRELKAFRKIRLAAGKKTALTFELDARAFSFYDVRQQKWVMEHGEFEIAVGSSSRSLRQIVAISL